MRLPRPVRTGLRLVATLALTFLGLLLVTFVIGRVVPIDPVLAAVGERASPDVYEQMRIELGLHLPLWQQFLIYVGNVLQGDFGESVLTANPVLEDISRVFPATLELATVATLLGVALGVPMGVAAAVYQGRMPDHVIRVLGLIGYSVPVFWLGLVGLLVFYATLDWVAGSGPPGRVLRGPGRPGDRRDSARCRARRRVGRASGTRSITSCCRPRSSATSRSPTSRA